MWWWIAGGVVAVAVVVFAVAVLVVLGRLREFGAVARALQRRLADASELTEAVADTQRRIERLQEPLQVTEHRMAVLAARRGDRDT